MNVIDTPIDPRTYNPQVHEDFARGYLNKLITADPEMQKQKRIAEKLAGLSDPVLILGETGTGKELLARAMGGIRHPFVSVNCAAITESLAESELFGHKRGSFTGAIADHQGYFEQAAGGCIFLDEINSLPLNMQAKLLRVLDGGEYRKVGAEKVEKISCRIIAASNYVSLTHADSQFRTDLYWRLATYSIITIPLWRREQDAVNYMSSQGMSGLDLTTALSDTRVFKSGNYREMFAYVKRWKFERSLSL